MWPFKTINTSLRHFSSLKPFVGHWALVTGASSGIGRAYALALAENGINIILVGRRRPELESLAKEFPKNTKSLIIPTDLTQPSAISILHQSVSDAGIRLRFLCHAAGAGYWGAFTQGSALLYADMVALHVSATISLCTAFHRDLASHSSSAMIIVSSLAGHHPGPTMATYAATKSAQRSISLALFQEWKSDGIYVQSLSPGPVNTPMSLALFGVKGKIPFKTISPQEVVQSSLRGLGRKSPEVSPGGGNSVIKFFFRLAPPRILLRAISLHFGSSPSTAPTPPPPSLSQPEPTPFPKAMSLKPLPPPPIPQKVNCPLCCHHADSVSILDIGWVRGNTKRFKDVLFPLWKCPNCLSIHSLATVDYADIYSDYPLNKRRLDSFARGSFQNLIHRLKSAGLQSGATLLDYGCGNGLFVDYLRSRGYPRAQGYDPYVPGFDKMPDPSKKYDAVIANDTLEHTDNYRHVMRHCLSLLKPGGLLYVGTADSEPVKMNDLAPHVMRLHQPYHRLIITESSLHQLGREFALVPVGSYRRSYLDTHRPFTNYRFLDELNRSVDHVLERALNPREVFKALSHSPALWRHAFFGYGNPSAFEPAVIWRKPEEVRR